MLQKENKTVSEKNKELEASLVKAEDDMTQKDRELSEETALKETLKKELVS